MKYCNACHLSVTGHSKYCPLCQCVLTGEDTPPVFPKIQKPRTAVWLRLLVFISIVAVVLSVYINTIISTSIFWAMFVVLGIASLWLSIGIAVRKNRDILKTITWQAFLWSALSIIWDYFTNWKAWSVNFVVPCIFLVTMIATPIISRIMKLPQNAYIFYFILVFGFGLIPAIFVTTDLVTIPIASYISVVVSLISIVALAVFGGRVIIAELYRKFHV